MRRRWLLWLFDRLYHEFAWTYDAVAWLISGGQWRRCAAGAIRFVDGPGIELGCGTGYLHVAGLEAGRILPGMDCSRPMLRQAAARSRRAGYRHRLVCAVAQALPLASSQFKTVVATFPAPFIMDLATLCEVNRVLVCNGCLVIVDGIATPLARRVAPLPYGPLLEAAGFTMLAEIPRSGQSSILIAQRGSR